MSFQLVVLQGRAAEQAIRLGSGVTTIGRQTGCQLTVRSSQVSRKHCQVFERDGRLVVKDLGSSNGTIVNGKKVDGLHVLSTGDILHVGPIKFRVEEVGKAGAVAEVVKPGSTALGDTPVPLNDDDIIDLMVDDGSGDDATTVAAPSKPAPAKQAASAAKANKPLEPETPLPVEPVVADDAVAEFLLNIDLDDEDKP
jgi:pSer/pThr/pTyr-binding forkhead associated (FHA) protein